MDVTFAALANGNLVAFMDQLDPATRYTVSAVNGTGAMSVDVGVAGQTLVLAYGGDEVSLYAYGTDEEAHSALRYAVSELAAGWLRGGALVEVTTPDGRVVTSD